MSAAVGRHTGTGVDSSPGIVIGRIQKLEHGRTPIPERKIESEEVKEEIARLQEAVDTAVTEIEFEKSQLSVHHHKDPLQLLEVYRLVLLDPELIGKAAKIIKNKKINAEWALRKRIDQLETMFDEFEDEYLRDKKRDIEQAGARIFRSLAGHHSDKPLVDEGEQLVLVAEDFSALDIVSFWRRGVAGIISSQGGMNSHAVIVARGIGMPALVGVADIMQLAKDGDTLVLDGEQGQWVLNPTREECEKYQLFVEAIAAIKADFQSFATQPSQTADGHELQLMANLEFSEQMPLAEAVGADGVGLFRTEFFLDGQDALVDEERQYQEYVSLVRQLKGKEATFRLFDIGGDKPFLYEKVLNRREGGENPAMGFRGVRLLLKHPEILRAQLRALLRAAEEGALRILIPMVTTMDEVEQIHEEIEACRKDLGIHKMPEVGTMIEVPAAAMIAEELASISDFFSVGTNDLIQYTLAADRTDEEVANIYQPNHPAICHLLEHAASAAKKKGITISVCGEMASNPQWTEMFLNMGMDSLSMSINRILVIRKNLSRLHYNPIQHTL